MTTEPRCPVCGAIKPQGTKCRNEIHPASRDAHRALAMSLPTEKEAS
jgi:hypothetical protein